MGVAEVRLDRLVGDVQLSAIYPSRFPTTYCGAVTSRPVRAVAIGPDGEAATLDSLGWIDQHTGHHHEAVDHYRQALRLFRLDGNNHDVAHTLDNLGHPHTALGRPDQAREVWQAVPGTRTP